MCAAVAALVLALIPMAAYASDGGSGGSITINVTVPKASSSSTHGGSGGGPLPKTGQDVIAVLATAGVMLGSGVLLIVGARRRRLE
jgi:LPXTG-motif cell wall-anchored protein